MQEGRNCELVRSWKVTIVFFRSLYSHEQTKKAHTHTHINKEPFTTGSLSMFESDTFRIHVRSVRFTETCWSWLWPRFPIQVHFKTSVAFYLKELLDKWLDIQVPVQISRCGVCNGKAVSSLILPRSLQCHAFCLPIPFQAATVGCRPWCSPRTEDRRIWDRVNLEAAR